MRANDVADAIIDRVPALNAMQLQKLLYYSQAWHLAITDRPLFDEPCQAWKDGPVVEEVWRARQDFGSRLPTGRPPARLTPTAEAIVELVCRSYGSLSGDELSRLTHGERPWLDARRGIAAGARSKRPIDHHSMAEFYREHRTLGGRHAEDLAAVGVFISAPNVPDEVDVDKLLASIEEPDTPPRNVVQLSGVEFPDDVSFVGIRTTRRGAAG